MLSFSYNTSIRELYENRCRTYGNEIIKQAGENINTLPFPDLSGGRMKRLISSVPHLADLLEYSASSIQKLDVIDDINADLELQAISPLHFRISMCSATASGFCPTTTKTNLEALKAGLLGTDAAGRHGYGHGHRGPCGLSWRFGRPSPESQQQQYAISFLRRLDRPAEGEQFPSCKSTSNTLYLKMIIKSVDVGQTGLSRCLSTSEDRILTAPTRTSGLNA
jgi:hypothetical protein